MGRGCTTGDVDHATHAFGQAGPLRDRLTTGVAGLTLSGGHGYLSRQYGLAVETAYRGGRGSGRRQFRLTASRPRTRTCCGRCAAAAELRCRDQLPLRHYPAGMIDGGPIIFDLSEAAAVLRWYREFQENAPDEFYIFLGLQAVPRAILSRRNIGTRRFAYCCLAQRIGGGWREGRQRHPRVAEADHRLGGRCPIEAPQLVPRTLPKGLQWYWKGHFREDIAGRGDRRASRPCRQAAKRGFLYAPHPIERRSPSAEEGRGRVGLLRRRLVDGDRRDRSGSGHVALKQWAQADIGGGSIRSISPAYANSYDGTTRATRGSRPPTAATTIASRRKRRSTIR